MNTPQHDTLYEYEYTYKYQCLYAFYSLRRILLIVARSRYRI